MKTLNTCILTITLIALFSLTACKSTDMVKKTTDVLTDNKDIIEKAVEKGKGKLPK